MAASLYNSDIESSLTNYIENFTCWVHLNLKDHGNKLPGDCDIKDRTTEWVQRPHQLERHTNILPTPFTKEREQYIKERHYENSLRDEIMKDMTTIRDELRRCRLREFTSEITGSETTAQGKIKNPLGLIFVFSKNSFHLQINSGCRLIPLFFAACFHNWIKRMKLSKLFEIQRIRACGCVSQITPNSRSGAVSAKNHWPLQSSTLGRSARRQHRFLLILHARRRRHWRRLSLIVTLVKE